MATTVADQAQLRTEVEALVEKLGPGRASLIPILADVKRQFHEIDDQSMQTIADVLGEEGFARSLTTTDLEYLFAED